jgi:hypothetical protein
VETLEVPPALHVHAPLASQLHAAAAPGTPPPAAPGAAWETQQTLGGAPYYRNTRTGETSWEPPSHLASATAPASASTSLTSRRKSPDSVTTPHAPDAAAAPPKGYVCHACGVAGHYIHACPQLKAAPLPALARADPDMEVWHAVEVPNGEFVQFLIGKKGADISQLTRHSGCRCINILDESQPGALLRRVELCGGTEQLSRAEADIRRRVREFQLRSKQRAAAAAAAAGKPQEHVPVALSDGEECVVCFVALRTHVLLPCGHRCLCAACARDYEQGGEWERVGAPPKCPMCRLPVKDAQRVWG